jgi:hypothetical protein
MLNAARLGASLVVNGVARASDSALTASADMKWMNAWSAAATFEGVCANVPNWSRMTLAA